MTDWKALCEELADSIELLLEMRPADAKPLSITEERYARARAALAAEADGPAVPEGREPASVVGQPSDEELLSLWGQAILGLAKGSTQAAVNLAFARAVLARWGRPAPAPDDRGVLPMIVSETGADDEPELERIICASISGGADYVNSMPRELRLERITPEGSTFARYIQVDADARPDVRPAPAPAGEVAELVASLRDAAASNERIGATQAAVQLTRAADLLEMCFSAKIAHDGSGNNE